MRGVSAILVGLGVCLSAHAETGSFVGLKARASVSADASGKIVGERFSVPATTTRKASDELEERPLADSISFAPDLGLVEGRAGASYTAAVSGNVISGVANGTISVEANKDGKGFDNSLLLTTSSSVTFDFTLPHTVAADLSVALDRSDGFAKVRTTLSGPSTKPVLDLENSGDLDRTLILPPGAYRLTFTHLTAAGVESDEAEPEAEAKGGASFSLAVDPCGADCNGDNKLDILDFLCFQARIEDRVKKADLNNDGKFDVLDMVVFQDLFVSGCER